MPKPRSYFYLIDGLGPEKGEMIKRALGMVPDVRAIIVSVPHGVVEVRSLQNPITQVKMACEIAAITFRTQIKRRHLA